MQITIPTSWNEISWSLFDRISSINSLELTQAEKIMKLISEVCGITVNEVKAMDASDIATIEQKISFLSEKPGERKIPSDTWECAGQKFHVDLYPAKFTAAQFIDYKVISEMDDIDRKIPRLIACFMYPEGKSYGEGYDIEWLVDFINEHMTVPEVTGYSNFFTVQYKAYASSLLESSMRRLSRQKGMSGQERKQLKEMLRNGKALINSFGI